MKKSLMSQSWFLKGLPLFFIFGGLSSCKKNPAKVQFQGFILGSNDMVAAGEGSGQDRINAAIKATGSIVSQDPSQHKTHYCTGALIAPAEGQMRPRILTNAHCFTENADPGKPLSRWACTQTKIFLGLTQSNVSKYVVGVCKPGSLRIDGQADIAVFELTEPLPADILWLNIAPESPAVGTQSLVVHYPVIPENMVMAETEKVKLPFAMLTNEDCQITPKEALGRGAEDPFSYDVGHSCDIISGSSGAPIIAADTGEIIALNWGGIEWRSTDSSIQENRGVGSGYIKAFIDNQVESYKSVTPPPSIIREGAGQTETEETKPGSLERGKSMVRSAGCAAKRS